MSSDRPLDEPVAVGLSADQSPPRLSRWQKFRMIVKVVELRLRFIALLAGTGLIFAYWDTLWNYYEKWTRPAGTAVTASTNTEFYCPMHPSVIMETPGTCPICGMPLSKRKKGDKEKLPEGVLARVQLSPYRVAQAGIRTTKVSYAPLAQTITTVGTVELDERNIRRIASKTKGMARVEKLFVNFTGTTVKAGEPLAEVYSSELYQALQELLLTQRMASERQRPASGLGRTLLGDSNDLVRLGRDRLRLWGITDTQIDAILASGRADFRLPILSPISGVVVRKNVFEGQYVEEGRDLFDVADLTHVWIKAQIYEDQLSQVQVGQLVEASVPAYPGMVFPGKVAFRDLVLNPATRTLTVRYDLDNRELRLSPGMFATVTLKTPVARTPEYLAKHPQRAHASTGTRELVSMTVEEQKICPVTNLKLGSMGDPLAVQVEGEKIWTCCPACSPRLTATPAKYIARLKPAPMDHVLSVPESAVVDTGTRKIVYVETDPGIYEAREVILGPLSGKFYPVIEGLALDEEVASEGSFLIDAENRLNPKAAGKPADLPTASHEATRSAAAPAAAVHRH